MNKHISISIILFFWVSFPGFSQLFPVYPEKGIGQADLIVTYTKTSQLDSLNSRKRKEKMTLLIGKNISLFYSDALASFIKATSRFSTQAELQAFASNPANNVRFGAHRYQIFKNYPEGKITTIDHIPSDHYLYTENLKLFNWEISGETDSIFGYKVQKATTFFAGRNWVAWFTTDLPYNEGPYKFNGLPGLIIKIHDTKNHYLFEAVSVEIPVEKTPINFTERFYIRTTKEGFSRAWNSFVNSLIGSTDLIPDSHTRHMMNRNLRLRNNPIELKAD